MPARLTVFPPDAPARQFRLDPDRRYLIGRSADCDLHVEDPRLSRRHAEFRVEDGCWRFDDLGSKNGTMLAGRAPLERALHPGDWISFGGLLGRFDEPSEERLAAEHQATRARWDETIRQSRALDPAAGVDRLLQQMLAASMELAGADRGFVMLADASGELQVRARAGGVEPATAGGDFPGSRGALTRALAARATVVVCDTGADTLLGAQQSVVRGSIRALACVPLQVGDQLTGIVYLDSSRPGKVFDGLDVEILEAFAAHAALVIGVASVREELAEVAKLLPPELSQGPAPPELLRELGARLPHVDAPPAKGGRP